MKHVERLFSYGVKTATISRNKYGVFTVVLQVDATIYTGYGTGIYEALTNLNEIIEKEKPLIYDPKKGTVQ